MLNTADTHTLLLLAFLPAQKKSLHKQNKQNWTEGSYANYKYLIGGGREWRRKARCQVEQRERASDKRRKKTPTMADDGEVSALVCDNGSGMVKVRIRVLLNVDKSAIGTMHAKK